MRIFWLLIAVLLIASVALVWARSAGDGEGQMEVAMEPARPAPVEAASPEPEPASPPPPPPSDTSADAADASDPDVPHTTASAEEGEDEGAPAPPRDDDAAKRLAQELFGAAEQREAEELAAQPEQDDARTLDGEFIVRGSGTEKDPYRITWDLLISAQQTYRPKEGLTEFPERVSMLDGKYVEIAGYYAFPLMVEESDELLVMLNQWDGCCIGVPPTPYDGIEVKLRGPMRSNLSQVNYATVVGRLKVDPYLVNDWLVGLYVMDDATLDIGL